jgi:uncharacterized protein (TIGR02246 family)
MIKSNQTRRLPTGSLIAAVGIVTVGAGMTLAFQEPATVSSRPVTAAEITPPAEVVPPGTVTTAVVVPVPLATERPNDVAAIQALDASFVQAWNAGDAESAARLFTENARIVDEDNVVTEGRAAISARFARRFTERPGETLTVTPETIRFLGPDTAIEEGTATIRIPAVGETPEEVETSRYTAVHVRRDGGWLQASIHDLASPTVAVPAEPIPAGEPRYEHLRQLEWLVGDWVEEGPDVQMTSSIAWSDNRTYLIRTFDLKAPGQLPLTGTQRIGWDPAKRQIRSWEFDNDGGFGEGIWSRRADGEWVVKMEGVRRDGRVVSDTRIINRVGSDHLTWKAYDRTIDGEIQDDTPVFSMVRRAPRPGEAKVKRVAQ